MKDSMFLHVFSFNPSVKLERKTLSTNLWPISAILRDAVWLRLLLRQSQVSECSEGIHHLRQRTPVSAEEQTKISNASQSQTDLVSLSIESDDEFNRCPYTSLPRFRSHFFQQLLLKLGFFIICLNY